MVWSQAKEKVGAWMSGKQDNDVMLDGQSLTLDQLIAVARHGWRAAMTDDAIERVRDSRLIIERALASGTPAYGVTTGFGALQDRVISPDQMAAMQENLVLSHAAGVGPHLPHDAVRAMIVLRANTFMKGFSGVRVELVDALLDLVNRGVTPVVPLQGSVGSSGDLAPLAHLACVLIGRGAASYQGEILPGAGALRAAGLAPLVLQAKEGLALTNGTQFMTAVGSLALADAWNLARTADIAAALSLEALKGRSSPFRPEVGMLRAHEGHAQVAENVRRLTAGSDLLDADDEDTAGAIQDAYSLRCVPQVHGASRSAFRHVGATLTVEMNSVNDNPLVLADEPSICSAGNFHGQPIALVLDYLALATAELGSISERRCARLVDERLSRGLPAFLVQASGLNSGLMIAQYTAAALASENKSLAHPASADSIPTCANQEDHNSMGSIAARHARAIVDNVTNVLAIEILCACQALDFRRSRSAVLGRGTAAAFGAVREAVTMIDRDREISGDIAAVASLIAQGELADAARAAVGELR